MAVENRNIIISITKYTLLICLTHLYIFICTLVYHKLEGFDESKQLVKQVDNFLLSTDLDIKHNPTRFLQVFHEKQDEEQYWTIRQAYNSISRCYLFTLASHTTLGNRHMMLQTWQSHLFYILTVPFGVILYYIMIHVTAKLYINNMQLAVMLVFRQEDKPLSEKMTDFYEKFKLVLITIIFTLLFILLLGMTSLLDGNHYVEEIYYIIDTILTISSSKHFVALAYEHDDINAFLSTLIYFTCIFFAYINMYAVINLFQSHDLKDFLLLCGAKKIYAALSQEDKTEDDDEGTFDVFDHFSSVPLAKPREGSVTSAGKTSLSSLSSAWDGTDTKFFQKPSGKTIEEDKQH